MQEQLQQGGEGRDNAAGKEGSVYLEQSKCLRKMRSFRRVNDVKASPGGRGREGLSRFSLCIAWGQAGMEPQDVKPHCPPRGMAVPFWSYFSPLLEL